MEGCQSGVEPEVGSLRLCRYRSCGANPISTDALPLSYLTHAHNITGHTNIPPLPTAGSANALAARSFCEPIPVVSGAATS